LGMFFTLRTVVFCCYEKLYYVACCECLRIDFKKSFRNVYHDVVPKQDDDDDGEYYNYDEEEEDEGGSEEDGGEAAMEGHAQQEDAEHHGDGADGHEEHEDEDEDHVDGLNLPEPFCIETTGTMLLVARGGAAGVGNKAIMRGKGGASGAVKQKLQSMVGACLTDFLLHTNIFL
jgi:hypothetical protein